MNALQSTPTNSSVAAPEKSPEPTEKPDTTPLFWRMFGTSTMAIAASLGIALYVQTSQSISAIRTDVTQLRESAIQMVPKTEFSRSHNELGTDIQTLQAKNVTAMEIWTARVTELERKLERMRTDHKEQVEAFQRENQQLRERLAVLEARSAKPKN
jgi:hypothetical protein